MDKSTYQKLRDDLGPVPGRFVVTYNGRTASSVAELDEIARIEGYQFEDVVVAIDFADNDAGLLARAASLEIPGLPTLNTKGQLKKADREGLRKAIEEAESAKAKADADEQDDDTGRTFNPSVGYRAPDQFSVWFEKFDPEGPIPESVLDITVPVEGTPESKIDLILGLAEEEAEAHFDLTDEDVARLTSAIKEAVEAGFQEKDAA